MLFAADSKKNAALPSDFPAGLLRAERLGLSDAPVALAAETSVDARLISSALPTSSAALRLISWIRRMLSVAH